MCSMIDMSENSPVLAKSMDYVNIVACLLNSVYDALGMVVSPRYTRLTIQKIENRFKREGYGFFTKSLPRLGKALDKALLGRCPLDCTGFCKEPSTQIPKLFGNLFKRVFDLNGEVLPNPCVNSIRSLRQLTFMFYKYELSYDQILETKTIEAFKTAEADVVKDVAYLSEYFGSTFGAGSVPSDTRSSRLNRRYDRASQEEVDLLRSARRLVTQLFEGFDLSRMVPKHGPGVVSTKETFDEKYMFKRINPRAQKVFPYDKFMYVNETHLCDELQTLESASVTESSAQVCLVPKDSRGPRVISCEPLENQWLQQGIMKAMVEWVERHPLTRNDIHFTDQEPNRMAALAGSYHGHLATLDLKEASDRVSVWLVEQLFDGPLLEALLATRSLATRLPDGSVLPFQKFAPMGSATCFPVLAITVWALLRAGPAGADKDSLVLVYGDDVIVDTAHAEHAIEQLETFGLHVNRDKSCISGLFRESCGMDAYYGEDVTPVRLRTVWSSTPAAGPYESWVAYANSLYAKGYLEAAYYIAERLKAVYGPVPVVEPSSKVEIKGSFIRVTPELPLSYPALTFDYDGSLTVRTRWHHAYQRIVKRVRVVTPKMLTVNQSGWTSLFRYFTERCMSRDETLIDIVISTLERLAQASQKSVDNATDCLEESGGKTLLGEGCEANVLVDYAIRDYPTHLLASLSSLTGLSLPVIHECITKQLRRHVVASFELHARKQLPLDVYSVPHTSQLKWAWR